MDFHILMQRLPLIVIVIVLAGLTACVSPFFEVDEVPREGEAARREEIVRQSMGLVGSADIAIQNDVFRNDCSGFVVGVYRSLDYRVELEYYNSRFVAENLFRNLHRKGYVYTSMRPKKADLAFFKNTVKNSGNRVTHVGLVSGVDEEETVLIVHYSSKGVSLMRLNLRHPHVHMNEAGNVLNDFLRKKTPGAETVPLLSGELFFMYGDLYSYIMD